MAPLSSEGFNGSVQLKCSKQCLAPISPTNAELLLEIAAPFHLGTPYLRGGKGVGVALARTEQWPGQHWASAWPSWEELMASRVSEALRLQAALAGRCRWDGPGAEKHLLLETDTWKYLRVENLSEFRDAAGS